MDPELLLPALRLISILLLAGLLFILLIELLRTLRPALSEDRERNYGGPGAPSGNDDAPEVGVRRSAATAVDGSKVAACTPASR